MHVARRVARLPGARRLLAHPRVAAALLARFVSDPIRFLLREATGRRVVAKYRLREAPGVTVFLRHRTLDVDVFSEIFSQRIYAAPEPVARRLKELSRPPDVVDLGANVGLFGAWARAHWPGARLVSFEPDPFNLRVLERTAAANGGDWTVVPACAAAEDGETAFAAGRYAVSTAFPDADHAASSIRVPTRDVLPILADADLIKVDIEGGEWPILADARFRALKAAAVTLEYHPQGCPSEQARTTALRLLEAAGFQVYDAQTPAPTGYGSLWAWRP